MNQKPNTPKPVQQLRKFLLNNRFRSEADFQMAVSFCQGKGLKRTSQIPYRHSEEGITAADFYRWYESGWCAGDIVEYDGKIGIIEISHFKAPLVDFMDENDKVLADGVETPSEGLKMASEEDARVFGRLLFSLGLQFDPKNCVLCRRYIPSKNEMVIFRNDGDEGIGVVREIDTEGDTVEFYCYYLMKSGALGYSMHEKGVVNISGTVFIPMTPSRLEDEKSGPYMLRKMQEALASHGKVWRQALKRVEPEEWQDYEGEYWYVNDRFKVCKGKAGNGKPVSPVGHPVSPHLDHLRRKIHGLGVVQEKVPLYLVGLGET